MEANILTKDWKCRVYKFVLARLASVGQIRLSLMESSTMESKIQRDNKIKSTQ